MVPEYLTIAEAARLIAAKELSPVELLDSRLQRIERLDSRLNSFIRVLAQTRRARDQPLVPAEAIKPKEAARAGIADTGSGDGHPSHPQDAAHLQSSTTLRGCHSKIFILLTNS